MYKNSNLFLSLLNRCLKNILIDLINMKNKKNEFTIINTKAINPKNFPLSIIDKHITTLIIENRDSKRNFIKNCTDSLLFILSLLYISLFYVM